MQRCIIIVSKHF